MKRFLDLSLSLALIIVLSPVILVIAGMIIVVDRHYPFYFGLRVGRGGVPFRMLKFRSMVLGSDRLETISTATTDRRVTRLGRVLRRMKLDELPQLFNIVCGQMSFVGPRPNVPSEIPLYTDDQKRLLSVRPGVTDLASIVFADEGQILRDSSDPDGDYRRLIWPWKSRLGLHNVSHRSLLLDLAVIVITGIGLLSRSWALMCVNQILKITHAEEDMTTVALRCGPLSACASVGSEMSEGSN